MFIRGDICEWRHISLSAINQSKICAGCEGEKKKEKIEMRNVNGGNEANDLEEERIRRGKKK